MNCTQVEELLALYAGHDLAGKHEQLVAAHLQSCVACSLAVAEYRDARGLMQDFAPAVFDDEVYAEIRENVWKRIESQPQSRALFEWLGVWFQPRLGWAAAAALMITVSFVGLYFIAKEFNVPPTVIVDVPRVMVPSVGPTPETGGGVPYYPDTGAPNKRQVNMPKRQRKLDRMVAPDRGNSLVAYLPDAEVTTVQSAARVIGTDNVDLAAPGSEKSVRLEIQTSNPNIRIIWFLSESPNQ